MCQLSGVAHGDFGVPRQELPRRDVAQTSQCEVKSQQRDNDRDGESGNETDRLDVDIEELRADRTTPPLRILQSKHHQSGVTDCTSRADNASQTRDGKAFFQNETSDHLSVKADCLQKPDARCAAFDAEAEQQAD